MQSARIVTLSFLLFELFSLELCPLKTIIYDYFIPGYDCAIVNYITDIFTRYELIVCMK